MDAGSISVVVIDRIIAVKIFFFIRVKLIVKVNAIHIISEYDVFHHIGQILAYGGIGRVKIPLFAIPEKPFCFSAVGQCTQWVRRSKCGCIQIECGAVRIHPGMEFNAAIMRGLNHVLKRIKKCVV